MDGPEGWEGLLAKDETILWQGRPGTGVIWGDLLSVELAMGIFFIVFSTLWISLAMWMGASIPPGSPFSLMRTVFPLFGTIFWLAGLYMVIGRLFWDAYVRARTHYTLTNKAAFIATELFGRRKLLRYPANDMRSFELVDGEPGTVWFTRETLTGRSGSTSRTRSRRIGFRRIADARQVWSHLEPHRLEATG